MSHLAKSAFMESQAGRQTVETLQSFNIRHVAQLDSLLQTHAGRMALDELSLPLDRGKMELLIDPLRQTSAGIGVGVHGPQRPVRGANALTSHGLGLGYRSQSTQLLPTFSQLMPPIERVEARDARLSGHFFATLGKYQEKVAPSISAHIIYPALSLPEPKNQGKRGTCVAFATASTLHAYIDCHVKNFTRITNFSEQYLYYEAKLQDRNRDDDGTRLECALRALIDSGVCAEPYLPYRTYVDWSHALLFQDATTNLSRIKNLAAGNRIQAFAHLPESNIVDNIKACLVRNLAVAIGVLTFREAWGNEYAEWRGEIELPVVTRDETDGANGEVVFDTSDGGHAICIIGYEDDSDPLTARPGGGAFLFKNSWGTEWAIGNEHQRGYGHLPYAYVEKYWLEATIIDGLVSNARGG